MLLNLASIIHTPGGIVPFSFSMDFSQSEFGGAYPAQEPVLVSGQVRNEAGVLLLSAEMKSTLHCVCDRCATPFLRDYTQKVSAVLVTELCHEENEDDWTFLLQGESADSFKISSLDVDIFAYGSCSGISRSNIQLLNFRTLGNFPCQCMFAAARA